MTFVKATLGVALCTTLLGLGGFAPAQASQARSSGSTKSLLSAKACATNKNAGPMTFVSPFDYDASAGIIDVVDAKLLGYFADLCLDVNIEVPSASLSPYELVSAGRGTVTGEGSAADTMIGTANGANLVAIATFGDTSDYALLTRPTITKLAQLNGKILGYHTQLPVVLTEMLKAAGAKLSTINEVNDTSYDPSILFDQKPGYSALQAYQSNEPLTLEAAGYKVGKAFREWTPSQFGVKGTFNVQVVNGTFLKKHPSTVADFLRAELRGMNFCLAHESSCVTMEQTAATKAGYSGSLSHSIAEWKIEAGLVRNNTLVGRGIGVETVSEWTPEAKAVVSNGLIKRAPDLSRIENTKLAASLYNGTSLIWP
jgi:NitT/TauT family transport system substrate-binding protein